MAIPRVETCCFYFNLETGGLLIAVICALGYASLINSQPLPYLFVFGMYLYEVFGFFNEVVLIFFTPL